MRFHKPVFAILTLFGLLTVAFAQTSLPSPTPRTGPRGNARNRRNPCWQQAGINQSAVQQVRGIRESTRSQVESVCSDSSLTPQQKHQKIMQLHQQARQQIDSIISPSQRQAIASCRGSRGGHMGGGHHGGFGHHGGPCGELSGGALPGVGGPRGSGGPGGAGGTGAGGAAAGTAKPGAANGASKMEPGEGDEAGADLGEPDEKQ